MAADEARHEFGAGMVEDVAGRALLLDLALVHHHDVVGERHRLFLAVGDLDEADAEFALQPLQLAAHLHPQERIERGERLVEQQDLRLGDQGAGERDALLLAAGELRRQPRRIGRHRDQLKQFAGALVPRRAVDAAHFQGKCDVVEHGQVRKQRVGLEHHRRAALGRLEVGDVLRAQDDVALADRLVAGDHAQGRGFATAGGAEQAAIGAGRNLQIDVVDRQRSCRSAW